MVDHLQSRVTPWRQYASHVKVRGTFVENTCKKVANHRSNENYESCFSGDNMGISHFQEQNGANHGSRKYALPPSLLDRRKLAMSIQHAELCDTAYNFTPYIACLVTQLFCLLPGVIILLLYTKLQLVAGCPSQCKCDAERTVSCLNRNLYQIPSAIPNNTLRL